ncbi:MAG TPA: tRNA (adenosine(37)-N6)-threonylcarbamoyltransferase complex ATPase subunit type 1 TsaE [Candidatus Paceibacterota bacterium]|nr:tRNA (adenosine(37)-N6)-threonylcarbamoyltransferase complex ATPase subunit type 1 TsaE [Candidatus Paceibacterota bacterium]
MREYVSEGISETAVIAQTYAKAVVEELVNGPVVVGLEGELGAGKTTFVQAFAAALGISEKLKSPTFTILKKYKIAAGPFTHLYHIDCYRLRDSGDLKALGIEEILRQPDAVILIEWPERVADILPAKRITIHIDHVAEQKRRIIIS